MAEKKAVSKEPLMVPFGAIFPGMIISSLFFGFAVCDFGVACAGLRGSALATAYYGGQVPVVGSLRAILPLSTPGLVLMLLKQDLYGLTKGATFDRLLGVGQLATVVLIYAYVLPKLLIPAITAVNDDGMTPEEATDLYAATGTMLAMNFFMLVSYVIKLYLGATSSPKLLVKDDKKDK